MVFFMHCECSNDYSMPIITCRDVKPFFITLFYWLPFPSLLYPSWLCPSALHCHGVVFLIALSVPLLSHLVPDLHWGQVLAGMIAEPAFLSEYTIFALDHSKRPKTAQVASVVSLPSRPASSSFFLLFLVLPRSFLPSLCFWDNR